MKKKGKKKKISLPQIEDTSSKWHGPHGKHQTGASAVIFHNLKCVIDLLHNISSLFFLRLTHISKCYTFEDPVETLQRTQTGSNNKQADCQGSSSTTRGTPFTIYALVSICQDTPSRPSICKYMCACVFVESRCVLRILLSLRGILWSLWSYSSMPLRPM